MDYRSLFEHVKSQEDLILFGKLFMPKMFKKPSPAFHYEMAEALLDQSLKQLNIKAPRGHAKSSLAAGAYPLYHAFIEAKPTFESTPEQRFIVLVSKSLSHAVELLNTIKEVLNYSEPFRAVFGNWGSATARRWTNYEIELANGTTILTRGTGMMVVGLKKYNLRPTLYLVDDPEDRNNTKTAEAMDNNMRWLLNDLVPGADPDIGRVIVIGTPKHQRCMVVELQRAAGWKTLHYKAVVDKDVLKGTKEPYDEAALWPEQRSIHWLLRKKNELESIGRVSSFYQELQCEVTGDEARMFQPQWLKWFDGELVRHGEGANSRVVLKMTHRGDWQEDRFVIERLPEPKFIPVNIFMGVDPASSLSATADYTAIVVALHDQERNYYIWHYDRFRAKPMQVADRIIMRYKQFYPKKTRIESNAAQETLRDYIRSQPIYIPGSEIKERPREQKSVRLETLQIPMARGKIFLRSEGTLQGMKELLDELLLYPLGLHEDLIDGVYYATKRNYPPTHSAEEVTEKKTPRKKPIDWMVA